MNLVNFLGVLMMSLFCVALLLAIVWLCISIYCDLEERRWLREDRMLYTNVDNIVDNGDNEEGNA